MHDLLRSLRRSVRRALREPAVSLPSVLVLGLAIGAALAVFGVVTAVLLEPLPYHRPDRLVLLWHRTAGGGAQRSRVPAPDVPELRRSSRTLEDVAFTNDVSDAMLTEGGERPEHLTVGLVTPNFFRVLGVRPGLGRTFRPGEVVLPPAAFRDTAFAAPPSVIVLGDGLWRERFGGDPGVLGRTVHLNGTPFTVVGVAPPGFHVVMPPDVGLASDVDAWTPLRIPLARFERAEGRWQDQDSDNTGAVIARMAPGASLEDVRAEMDLLASRQRAAIPSYRAEGTRITARPMQADVVAAVRTTLLLLLAAVGLVLLVASLNVSGLLLTRNLDRAGDLRIRLALGAGRARLLREEFVYGLTLAALGALVGVALAGWVMRILPALAPAGIPLLGRSHLDMRVLAFAGAATLGVAVASGLLPTLVAMRSTRVGHGGRVTGRATPGPGRSASTVIAVQVALSVVLLVGAGLLLRSFASLRDVRPGFETRGLATFRISLPGGRFGGPSERASFMRRYTDRLRSLPGVRAVGIVGGLPLGGHLWTRPYGASGEAPAEWRTRSANFRVVDSRYFGAMGTRLLAGRPFSEREDLVEAGRVAIVDATLARRISPDGTARRAVGASLGFPLDGRAVEAEVVGVVEPVHYESLRATPRATIYVPYRQEASRTLGVAVRTSGSPRELEAGARRELRRLHVSSDVPIFDFRPMQAYVRRALAPVRFALVLVLGFAFIALVLASVGVYGTVAYAIRRRRREIGIRMAVGASPAAILRRFAMRGFGPVLLGLGVGLALCAAASGALRSVLVLPAGLDGPTLAVVTAGMVVVGVIASLLPARAATRVQPSEALREE
ncbi:MAG TPA: ADOP family duplicated permease [Gemmatimonadota bacterium]|nr:ADOP family duplicated permease [Gemmatimonadota bacterium]